jgi:putative ABC transport system permease protein
VRVTLATLAWRNLARNPVRTALTVGGVGVAMLAFLFVRGFLAGWSSGVAGSAADLLIVRNRISLTFPLPRHYVDKVRAVPGVAAAGYDSWFGGVYRDGRDKFSEYAVDDGFFAAIRELEVSPADRRSFDADPAGAIVGARLAERFHWKIGDRITLAAFGGYLDLTVRGIYRTDGKGFDDKTLLFHWSRYDALLPERFREQVGVIVVRLAAGARSTEVARAIDRLFANSPAETRSESARQFALQLMSMASAVLRAMELVAVVVLLVLMLILGNTLALSTNERAAELALLGILGFPRRQVMALVVAESVLIALAGAAVGLLAVEPLRALAARSLSGGLGTLLADLTVGGATRAAGVGAALAAAALAALWPAHRAASVAPVEAMRKVT